MPHPNDYRCYAIEVKPIGSVCNLRCTYCYYLGKKHHTHHRPMSNEVLERYISQVTAIHGSKAEIEFAWHGGEPTLCGIDFFERAVALQRKYASGRRVLNTLQTNGTLLDNDWCRFFADNDFRIGISIDGPQHLHDRYRKDAAGRGTFSRVMNAIEMLRKAGVQYNTLTTVNATNADCGAEVYRFLRTVSDYMQFLPVLECVGEDGDVALPPGIYSSAPAKAPQVAPFSVSAEGYGKFLCDVFDCWKRGDVGRKFVQTFEAAVGNLTHRPAGLCVHEGVCGHCAAIESDGDVFRCDRYVFDEYRIGNIMRRPLYDMMESNRNFGMYKVDSLSQRCLHCDVVEMCFGGCPKDRIDTQLTLYGEERDNHLCAGYRRFFRYFKRNFKANLA